MIRTIEVCDLCKKEVKTYKMNIPVFRTFDSEEGKINYNKKKFYQRELDLCEECLNKITKVQDVGIMCEDYVIKELVAKIIL